MTISLLKRLFCIGNFIENTTSFLLFTLCTLVGLPIFERCFVLQLWSDPFFVGWSSLFVGWLVLHSLVRPPFFHFFAHTLPTLPKKEFFTILSLYFIPLFFHFFFWYPSIDRFVLPFSGNDESTPLKMKIHYIYTKLNISTSNTPLNSINFCLRFFFYLFVFFLHTHDESTPLKMKINYIQN